ncbi:MAG: type II toxin-antitoxin system HicB family antitoxin [bacterium]
MTLSVFIQPKSGERYLASVLGWPDFIVEAKTKEDALKKVKTEMDQKLSKGEIVRLEYEPANDAHPWMKFAGMWKDDPTFDDFLNEIEAYRQELDKEWNV